MLIEVILRKFVWRCWLLLLILELDSTLIQLLHGPVVSLAFEMDMMGNIVGSKRGVIYPSSLIMC